MPKADLGRTENMMTNLKILSLGGGVQSTVLALLADEGAFGDKPDAAIFADTHWELPETYENIKWLQKTLSYPVHVVDGGLNLREDTEALRNHSGNTKFIEIPLYLKGSDRTGNGLGKRQCTTNYKIKPVHNKARELLGLKPRQKIPAGTRVEMWLGISLDEIVRMRDSRDWWIVNRYPLVDANMTRQDCNSWWKANHEWSLARSACAACPFQSRSRWIQLKENHPDLFDAAVKLDSSIRDGLNYVDEPYLHKTRRPLAEAVALDQAQQLLPFEDDFMAECEGHCGL